MLKGHCDKSGKDYSYKVSVIGEMHTECIQNTYVRKIQFGDKTT